MRSHRKALVLIDLQKGFYNPIWGQRNNPNLEVNIQSLLEAWRDERRPIFHIAHDSFHDHSPLRQGQAGFEFIDECRPRDGERVLHKRVNSAFIGTSLEIELRRLQIKNVHFCGLTTDHCVSTSLRMAANLGFSVTVYEDCVATFPKRAPHGQILSAEQIQLAHLASLNEEFAEVLTFNLNN